MIFETLFFIGLLGFVGLFLLGAAHGHGHHGGDGHAHVSDVSHCHVAHAHTGHVHGPSHGHHDHGHQDSTGLKIPMFLSPMNIFSICLGIGASGLLLRSIVSGPLIWLAAVLGGLILTFAMVRPVFNMMMKFESKPSDGLEGMVAKQAEAVGNFDADGRGILRIEMDGEIVQLLARLTKAELLAGTRVSKGDKVTIMEINATKGTCEVSRELTLGQ